MLDRGKNSVYKSDSVKITGQNMTDESTNTSGSVQQTPEITINKKVQAIIVKVADEWDEALKALGDE